MSILYWSQTFSSIRHLSFSLKVALLVFRVAAFRMGRPRRQEVRTSAGRTSSRWSASSRTRPRFRRRCPSWWSTNTWGGTKLSADERLPDLARPGTCRGPASWRSVPDVCKPPPATATSSLSCSGIRRWSRPPCSPQEPGRALRTDLKPNSCVLLDWFYSHISF